MQPTHRLVRLVALVVAVLCGLLASTPAKCQGVSAGAAEAHSGPATFLLFKDFLDGVSKADAGSYVGAPGTKVESREAFEGMRRHVLSLYEGVKAIHSFLLDSQYVDCIPTIQQPSVRALGIRSLPAPPPPVQRASPLPPQATLARSPLGLGLSDKFGNLIECPDETIPMRRITLDELSRFKNLQESFQKHPDLNDSAQPALNGSGHRYAIAQSQVNNTGAQAVFNVWYPSINLTNGPAQFSLSQMWVFGGDPNQISGNPLQTVEAGWIVSPFRWGSAAVLFIFWTSDSYHSTGCFNLDCPGFVQTSQTAVLGAPNWPGPSTPGGQQVDVGLEWQLFDGNWWLSLNCDACFVGYYPGSIFGSGALSRGATSIEFGGEVFNGSDSNFAPMGSGAFASAGFAHAAYQSDIGYFLQGYFYRAYFSTMTVNNACYSQQLISGDYDVLYFGGPGGATCPP